MITYQGRRNALEPSPRILDIDWFGTQVETTRTEDGVIFQINIPPLNPNTPRETNFTPEDLGDRDLKVAGNLLVDRVNVARSRHKDP
jgi:hypothetical protein